MPWKKQSHGEPKKKSKMRGKFAGDTPIPAKLRRAEVEQMMTMQVSSRQIQKAICEKFGCADRTVRNDILWVHKQWDTEASLERPARRSQLRLTLRRLLYLALKKSDLRAAIAVCDRLARLDGLNEAPDITVTQNITKVVNNMTSAEQRAELDRIFEQYGAPFGAPELVSHRGNGANGANGANGHGTNGTNGTNGSGGPVH